jgi:GntR family transcriptional repressor for pyruvate dehydrogenase complex
MTELLISNNFKRPPAPKPIAVQVVDRIQGLIQTGELNPGDQLLPERELAEKLGVSRTSVRKAMATLEGRGIIEVTPRDGAYVRRPNLEEAMEPLAQALFHERDQVFYQFEVRQMIETQAVRLAAQRRSASDLAHLREINRQFEAELQRGETGFEANSRFHIAIIEAAKNPVLTEIMVTLLRASIQVYAAARQRSLTHAPNVLEFVAEHQQIIEAIAQQNPDLAAELMAQHVDAARRRIEQAEK